MTCSRLTSIFCVFVGSVCALLAACSNADAATSSSPAANAWPQHFEVGGPESTSFVFAVTQPGPVRIDVRWDGPPLIVELRGPQTRSQAGQGRAVIEYQVTAKDLESGIFWQIRLALQSAAPVAARGTIDLRRPSVDDALVQSRLESDARRAPSEAVDSPSAEVAAAFERDLETKLAQVDQDRSDGVAAAADQTAGDANGTVKSRALRPDARMDVQRQLILQAIPPTSAGETAAATRPLASPVAIQQITSVAPDVLRPFNQFTIRGTGFGSTHGTVHVIVNPGVDLIAPINGYWTDTQINARIDRLTGVVASAASVYVVANGGQTLPFPTQFAPLLKTRAYIMAWPPAAIGAPGSQIPVSVWPSGSRSPDPARAPASGVQHRSLDIVGRKGNDELFRGVALKNGWVIEDVIIAIYHAHSAGAYVAEFNKGSSTPVVNIRWWIDAHIPFDQDNLVTYTLAVIIKGPEDTADGWVVR